MNRRALLAGALLALAVSGCSPAPEPVEPPFFAACHPYPRTQEAFTVRWLQPENKGEPCKLFSYVPHSYAYRYEDAHLFWDGGCEEGYASGLGKATLYGTHVGKERIAVYEKGKIRKYCHIENGYNRTVYTGECTEPEKGEHYGVTRFVEEGRETVRAGRYHILERSGTYVEIYGPGERKFYKVYVKDGGDYFQEYYGEMAEAGQPVTVMGTMENGEQHGGIRYRKEEKTMDFLYDHGKPVKETALPDGYEARLKEVKREAHRAMVRALEAEREGLALKRAYEESHSGPSGDGGKSPVPAWR